MKNVRSIADFMYRMLHKGLLATLLLAALQCVAQTRILYDDFDQKFLNQTLWYSVCGGFSVTENCATDIQDEHLHLSRGLMGNTDSNSGANGGSATAFFIGPYAINSITTDIQVRYAEAIPCGAIAGSGGHADVIARFFNSGSGNVNDDVGASIAVERDSFNPKGQLSVLAGYFTNGDYSHVFSLTNITIGTPVTVTVTWDQPNHRFLYSVTNKLTHVTNSTIQAYPYSDTTPAVDPEKHLDIEVFPANCTSNQTWVQVDALFDNVYVSQ